MPIDPQAQAFLDFQAALGFPGYHQVPVEQARALMLARDRNTPREEVARFESVQTEDGLRLWCYWPQSKFGSSVDQIRPALVFFHGGGWVVGAPETCDVSCRALANASGCVVVSVDYRLAPEHRFPTQVQDALAAWLWVQENADRLRIDPARAAIGGDSAGGNLAVAACLAARDLQATLPAFQLLIYPVADHNFESESYNQYAEGYGLTRDAMRYFWELYLNDPADARHPHASILRADLSGLPAAWVAAAEFDPLRSEVEALHHRFLAHGVPSTYRCYEGQVHGFFHLGRVMEQGKAAIRDSAQILRETLLIDD